MANYTVESIDVDGDNVPDGDLVTQWKNGKVVSRKFVAYKKMQEVTNQILEAPRVAKNKAIKVTKRRPVVAPKIEATAAPENRVIVQDDTGFMQLMKQGAGHAAGSIAVNSAVNVLKGLFE